MITEKIQTPCFVLDIDQLRKNIHSFKTALSSKFPNSILGYSVKTNSYPSLLEIMYQEGAFAEVVSYNEYNLVKKLGFPTDRIIYNGPMKDRQTFLEAVRGGSIVNIDTKRELMWLKDLPRNGSFSVGLRVNLNLKKISPEDCKERENYSRFGFSIENNEFENALCSIKNYGNIRLAGLHLHRTSKTRSLQVYSNICRYAVETVSRYNLELDYIDIGGGYYGDMPGKPTYSDYVNSIAEGMSSSFDLNKLKLIVEPGNALIASPFSYYTSIIDAKDIGDNHILVTDGTRNDVDPFFRKTDYFKTFFRSKTDNPTINNQTFVGCTCLENDILFELKDSPQSNVGDIIQFAFVGAYTMCLSPLFIRYFPKVYLLEGAQLSLDRREWTEKEYLQ